MNPENEIKNIEYKDNTFFYSGNFSVTKKGVCITNINK